MSFGEDVAGEEGFVPRDPDSYSLDNGQAVSPVDREFSTNLDEGGIEYLFDN